MKTICPLGIYGRKIITGIRLVLSNVELTLLEWAFLTLGPLQWPLIVWIPGFQYDKSNIDFRLDHADNDLLFFLNLSNESTVSHFPLNTWYSMKCSRMTLALSTLLRSHQNFRNHRSRHCSYLRTKKLNIVCVQPVYKNLSILCLFGRTLVFWSGSDERRLSLVLFDERLLQRSKFTEK